MDEVKCSPKIINWEAAGFGAMAHESASTLSTFSGPQEMRPFMSNSFRWSQITSWLMMSMLPNAPWPVVVTAQYFVMRQFPAPIGIGPLVAFYRAAVRGVQVGQLNDVSVGEKLVFVNPQGVAFVAAVEYKVPS